MRLNLCRADANGVFRVVQSGNGFRIAPALPAVTDARYTVDQVPGQLPLEVQLSGVGDWHHYGASDVQFPEERFTFVDVRGAEPSSWYVLQTYERGEGMVPAGKANRRAYRVAPAGTAVPTVSPTLATDGFPVRPGSQSFTIYSTAGVVSRIWVRSVAGNWKDTGIDLDFVTEPTTTRYVDAPGSRWALVASIGGMTIEVDGASEVG
jgi:hypothetical protein